MRADAEHRVVNAVTATMFVHGLGASAVLPMLPLFLRQQHTTTGMIGAVIASYFVAGVLTQYASGYLTDRAGHRRVIIGGLAVYAVASVGFLASFGAGGYLVLRALQGLGAGALTVAGLALVGVVVPVDRRGRAFSRVFAAQLGGMAVGPTIGSIVGTAHIRWLFVLTSAAAVVATLPIAWGAPSHTRDRHEAPAVLVVSRGLVGVLLVGVAGGAIGGAYESCWSLLMASRGAHVWQVGLSWTLFAIPFAAISPLAGRLVDRHDRRPLAIGALLASAGFAVTYPFLPTPTLLIGLGVFESVAVAIAFPAAQSLLTETAGADALGRAQGMFTTAETAAIAVTAAFSGYLFSVARWLPFIVTAAIAVAIAATLPRLWRAVPGHARREPEVPQRAPATISAI